MGEFTGFGDQAFGFLKAIGFHQDRAWFHDNKALYEAELKRPLGLLVEDVTRRLATKGIPLKGSPKASTFRINRDVRFTKEKHPYNTHVSAVLTPSGTKKDMDGLYVHVTPGGTFIAAGVWHPDAAALRALREEIVARPEAMLALEADLAAKGLAFETDAMLARGPAGFKGDHCDDVKRLLRHKTFTLHRDLPDEAALSSALAEELVRLAEDAMPLMTYARRIVDPTRESAPPGT